MASASIREDDLEQVTLAWLESLGYNIIHGPDIAPEEPGAERDDYTEVFLSKRFRESLERLNPNIPSEALDDAFKKVTRPEKASLLDNNRAFHRMLIDGVGVEYRRKDGSISGDFVRLIDFDDPDNNDWLAVNQYTVEEGQANRRPDIVLFINGLPIGVLELKNPMDENATIWSAYNQLQTYKNQISSLFAYNEVMVVSDGLNARIGSLTSGKERFMRWRTIEGEELATHGLLELEVLVRGVFEKERLLDLIKHFIVFEEEKDKSISKKIAGYHQFHAVLNAVNSTVQASSTKGDKRCGVVWHTQGSGKSLTMVFYTGMLVLNEALENPTIVVITDRNDLDDQLFGTFAGCHELLRQKPKQAENRDDLRNLLKVASGGVIFTTVQKFFPTDGETEHPLLSERKNIIVIADEAHRSQYDFIDGYARHMRDALPGASFIGFTGTPIELTDKNTRAVFGEHISVYDIQRAVDDGATVPIYYESRLARLELKDAEKSHIDEHVEEVTEGEELSQVEKLKTKWAALEGLVGSEERIELIAKDLVEHYEKRLLAMDGKAMIVCMSRRICVDLYNALVKLRPKWHGEDDDKGEMKVLMTGSASDPLEWQQHIRNKSKREKLAERFKDSKDPFKVVIVRDMWLTGFDVPCLHTMYIDKPMRGHGLMQSIARVNRVFKEKPGGLVVDYLGLADSLRRAMAEYTESGGEGRGTIDQKEAVAVMLEKFEICRDMFHGYDWSWWTGSGKDERLLKLPEASSFILEQEDGKQRFINAVTLLTKAFALAVPHDEALCIRDDVAFFQYVQSALKKTIPDGNGKDPKDVEHAIKQIVSDAISSDEIIDIFAVAGLKKPDISILSDEFLAEVQGMQKKDLAFELLRKLLNDEIKVRSKRNLVQSRSFAEMLEKSIIAYHNRAIETAKIIEDLIALAKGIREADMRGENLGLTEDEVAFYDALETNDSAVKVLGDETLKAIAQELVKSVRSNVTIDWTVRENVKAKLRVMVKRILKKYGYPPDKQERATKTVLEQAEMLCEGWA